MILKASNHWIGICVDENKILSWQVSSPLNEVDVLIRTNSACKRLIFALRKSLKSLSGVCILYSQTVVFECSRQEKKIAYKKMLWHLSRSVTPFESNSIIKSALVFDVNRLFQK